VPFLLLTFLWARKEKSGAAAHPPLSNRERADARIRFIIAKQNKTGRKGRNQMDSAPCSSNIPVQKPPPKFERSWLWNKSPHPCIKIS
jgi:hypothetical protein